jgi:hypothetical protein
MLQLILDEFAWRRPASRKCGFAWQGVGEAMHLSCGPGHSLVEYRPRPGLFRDFAGLQSTPAAILKFANRHGALRRRPEWDSLLLWQQGVRRMRELVTLSDAVSAGTPRQLEKALEPFLADVSLRDADELRPIHQARNLEKKVPHNELLQAAVTRLYLSIEPVARLRGHVSWNARTRHVELRLQPQDLLGFLFLQLGYGLLANRLYRPCQACGKWILIQPGHNRADRATCSGYCRLKRSRQRRAQAIDLHRRGWTFPRIARDIGSSTETVERWVLSAER